MMEIVCTNKNRVDFQSVVFELKDITWDNFMNKVKNNEEFIQHIGKSSIPFGKTTKRLYHGSVSGFTNKQEHFEVVYEDGSISTYCKTGLESL